MKKSYNPEWKEVLSFTDMFPPLCNRIKVQICDSDALKDDAIGTHFLELSQIMDPGGDSDGGWADMAIKLCPYYRRSRDTGLPSIELMMLPIASCPPRTHVYHIINLDDRPLLPPTSRHPTHLRPQLHQLLRRASQVQDDGGEL